jgi:hypothetical protein
VASQVVFIPYAMFPKTALPKSGLTPFSAGFGGWWKKIRVVSQCLRGLPLDHRPAGREPGIIIRQGPKAMQVIR